VVRVVGIGRGGKDGLGPPWIFLISAKKVCFFVSRGENKFHHIYPLHTLFIIPLVAPSKKNIPTPMAKVRVYLYV